MARPGDSELPAALATGPADGRAHRAPGDPAHAPVSELLPAARSRTRDLLGRPFLDDPDAAPRSARDAGFWILFAVLGWLVGQFVAAELGVIACEVAGHPGQFTKLYNLTAPPTWLITTVEVGLWLGFLAAPFAASMWRGTRRFFTDLGLRLRWVDFLGVPIGIASQYLVTLGYRPFASHLKHFTAPVTKLTGGAHGPGLLVPIVVVGIGAPIFEELLFRGLLLRGLARACTAARTGPFARRGAGVAVAVVADGVVFALAHAEWQQFAGLAAFGIVLAVLSYRTGRLGMNMAAHCAFNLTAVSIFLGWVPALVPSVVR